MDVNGALFTIEYMYGEKYHEKTRLSNIRWRDYKACCKFAENSDKACNILAVDGNGEHHIKWVIGNKYVD